jgi:hypothetical protein
MTMAASTTTQRPAALPTQAKPNPVKVPVGAVKLAKVYLDGKDLPQQSPTPVPVDDFDRRTAHLLMQCPHMAVINGGGKERCPNRDWLLPDEARPYCPRHGKQYEPLRTGPSVLVRTARAGLAMHGRAAAPWVVPGVALAADVAMNLTDVGALEAMLTAPVLAGGTYLAVRRTLTARAIKRRKLERGRKMGRRYAAIKQRANRSAATGLETALWLSALAGTDITSLPGIVIAGAGMLRWAFASRTWWHNAEQRRLRGPELNVEQPAAAAPVTAPDPIELNAVTTWATRIGCPGGPLAGTKLVDFERLPACEVDVESRTILPNWKAKVVAKEDGTINMREQRTSLLGRIAAAYKCTYADVSFYADEDDLSVGWVRVQPDNPLAETRLWVGQTATDWKTGTSLIGRFDDGLPIAYQWADEGGACHDLLGGCSGSGKSELVAQLMLISLHSNGLVLDWLGDPQRGQSFGALKDEVDWFAGDKAEIKLMLLAAVKEMFRRNALLSKHNIKTWTFKVAEQLAMPLLVITLDEVQNYIDDPDILELVTTLAGMARKCGIKLRLITQIIAAYNLGGDTYIKEQVKTGQTFTFRAETDVAGRSAIEGDSPIDPTALPKRWGKNTCAAGKKTAGLVFVQGVHGRDVYGRTDFTGEDMAVWLKDPNGDPSVCPGRFSPEAQQESGVLWGDRKARARRLIETGRDDADLLPNGRALELIESAAVSSFSDPRPISDAAPVKEQARDVVLAAAVELVDANGQIAKGDLKAAVKGKMQPGTLDTQLTALVGDGELVRVRNGVYRFPEGARHEGVPA